MTWDSKESCKSDDSFPSVQVRSFDSVGASVGEQFQVSAETSLGQVWPSVAFAQNGEFVVAWMTGREIAAQRFAALPSTVRAIPTARLFAAALCLAGTASLARRTR